MADRTQQILPGGQSSAPFTYTIPASTAFRLLAVRATLDGTGAAGAFLPCVQLVSDAGQIMAQTIGASVAVGASADATFAPFLRGQAAGSTITVVPPGGIVTGWDAIITKSADESVTSSAVLQNDDELFFATVAGGVYEYEAVLVYTSAATGNIPGFRFAWGEDSNLRGAGWDAFVTTTPQGNVVGTATDQGATLPEPAKSSIQFAPAAAISRGVHVANGGTFRLIWAQLSASGTATTLKAGSVLRYRKVL